MWHFRSKAKKEEEKQRLNKTNFVNYLVKLGKIDKADGEQAIKELIECEIRIEPIIWRAWILQTPAVLWENRQIGEKKGEWIKLTCW